MDPPRWRVTRSLLALLAAAVGGLVAALACQATQVRYLIQANCTGTINVLTHAGNPCTPGPSNVEIGPEPLVFGLFVLAGAFIGLMLVAVAWAVRSAAASARRVWT
ncbi:MAG: hypothetical protein ACRDGI_09285 [Candidatus Limnocylindrales bacterium]